MTPGKTSSAASDSPKLSPVVTPDPELGGHRTSVTTPNGPEVRDRSLSHSYDQPEQERGRPSFSLSDPDSSRTRARSDSHVLEAKRPRGVSADEKHGGDDSGVESSYRSVPNDLDVYDPPSAELQATQTNTPTTRAGAQRNLEDQAVLLIGTLAAGGRPLPDQHDTHMYIVMSAVAKSFKDLLSHGASFAQALAVFRAAVGGAFLILDSDQLRVVLDGADRLDYFARDSDRLVVNRTLATAVLEMNPQQLRRAALDQERAGQPAPTDSTDIAKQAALGAWRRTKRKKEGLDKKIGPAERQTRQADEARAKTRAALDTTLGKVMTLARAGGPARDTILATNLRMLTTILKRADGSGDLDNDEFLAFAEDFMLNQETDVLVAFARALVDTAPGRTKTDERLNALGASLHAVLNLRPGCEDVTRDLRNTQLSGSSNTHENFVQGRLHEAMTALANPAVLIDPKGKTHVAGVFIGLLGVIPVSRDKETAQFDDRVRGALKALPSEQLVQIQKNLVHAYRGLPIGRVSRVYMLVGQTLSARALRSADVVAREHASAQSGPGPERQRPQSVAHLSLLANGEILARTLATKPQSDARADAALLFDFMKNARQDFHQLLNEGMPFAEIVEAFGTAAAAELERLTPSQWKILIDGIKRLEGLPMPMEGAIIQRRLIEVFQSVNARKEHRARLTLQRENAPKPVRVKAIVKDAWLTGWRGFKGGVRTIAEEIEDPREKRKAEERARYREGIDGAMAEAISATRPGSLARDADLTVALARLARRSQLGDNQMNSKKGRNFLARVEDHMLTRTTDELVHFASVLLETAPSRPQDDRLNRLGVSLAEILELRPGGEEAAHALRERELAGPVVGDATRLKYRVDRATQLMKAIAGQGDAQEPEASKAVQGAIQDMSVLMESVDAAHNANYTADVQRFVDQAAQALTPEERTRVIARLQPDELRIHQSLSQVAQQLLAAMEAAQQLPS